MASITRVQDGEPRRFEVAIADWAFDHEPAMPSGNGRLLRVDEAAGYVGCHKNTIYLAAQTGELASRGYGRMRRFTVADLDEWTRGRR